MELELEHVELKRKRDLLRLQGRIDTSHEHDYSGSLSIAVQNVGDYLSILHPGTVKSKPAPAEIEAKIDSARWDARGRVTFPNSSPLDFTANFPLPIGADWNAILGLAVNFTVEFPSIFLANAPQIFHPPIFHDGILSGKLSLSETLQHPRVAGDVQLINGKLQSAYLNLTDVSSRLTFNGDHGSIDFLNAATKDVDLSLRGDLDLRDTNDLAISVRGSSPIFDFVPRPMDCVGKIDFAPVAVTLSPPIEALEFRGGLIRSNWTVALKETQSAGELNLSDATRKLPLCPGPSSNETTLLLGAPARPSPTPQSKRKRH
jgi:hypothetical protein